MSKLDKRSSNFESNNFLSHYINIARKELALTQMQVAESASTDHSYISKTENNKSVLNKTSAELISKRLGINLLLFDLETGGKKDLEGWVEALFYNDETILLKYDCPSLKKYLPHVELIRQVMMNIINNDRLTAESNLNKFDDHVDKITPYMSQMITILSAITCFNNQYYSATVRHLKSFDIKLENDDLLKTMQTIYLAVSQLYLEKPHSGLELIKQAENLLSFNYSEYYKVFVELYKKMFQQREAKDKYYRVIDSFTLEHTPKKLSNLLLLLKLKQTTDPDKTLKLLSQLNLEYNDKFKYDAIIEGLKHIEDFQEYYEKLIEKSEFLVATEAKNELSIIRRKANDEHAKDYNAYSFELACHNQDISKARSITQMLKSDAVDNKRYKEAHYHEKRFRKFINKIT